MIWIDAVGSGQGVRAAFGGEVPPLARVDVQEMDLTYRGPSVLLTVALRDYPADPPAKWATQGFDTVLLTLYCFAVRDVRLTGWDNEVTGDITIERDGDRVAVRLDSAASTLTLTALSVDVQKVSAYRRGPDDARG